MNKKQSKMLIVFSLIMIVLNTYALYKNIIYYTDNHHDIIESSMLLFNVVSQAYCIYILFLFRALKINIFDKLIIYSIGSISIFLNFYYLLLDYQWNSFILTVIFWTVYNSSMIIFSLIIFHFLYKQKTFLPD